MSKYETKANIVNNVNKVPKERLNGNYNEHSEMTAMAHGGKINVGRLAKNIRKLEKINQNFNILSKHSQNSHNCKCEDWDDDDNY